MDIKHFGINGYKGFYNCSYKWIKEYIKELDNIFAKRDIKIIKETPDRYNGILKCYREGKVYKFHIKYDDFARKISLVKMVRNLFKKSRCMNSWEVATRMIKLGIPTPLPIAAGEKRKAGLLIRSFYISEFIEGAMNIYDYFLKNKNRCRDLTSWKNRIIKDISSLIGRMHKAGIAHGDLKRNNILVSENYEGGYNLFLIDIESASIQGEICESSRIKDLGRLYKSFMGIASNYEMMRFIAGYFRNVTINGKKKRVIIDRIKKSEN